LGALGIRQYGDAMDPLGFRFDVDAIIVSGVAHRAGCSLASHAHASTQVEVGSGGVYRADRCPRERPRCRPPFETMLSYQFGQGVCTAPPDV
jgi:hypothetical protein